jgi:hypothetical protein
VIGLIAEFGYSLESISPAGEKRALAVLFLCGDHRNPAEEQAKKCFRLWPGSARSFGCWAPIEGESVEEPDSFLKEKSYEIEITGHIETSRAVF